MVHSHTGYAEAVYLEHGLRNSAWKPNESLSAFIARKFAIYQREGPAFDVDQSGSATDIKPTLKARKLKKRLGLKFRPTDDLSNHLKLDRRQGDAIVLIFNQIAYLKEQLRLTKDTPKVSTLDDWLLMGALPRQLVLECLDSIQKVLFPLSDKKSRVFLRSLISKHDFDPEMLIFESADIRNVDEKDISYLYFGSRFADLADELENPKPQSWLEKWFERKSGARYVMMATLIGAGIAVILGMASLALGGYQAWVAYQQWKHPTHN